MVVTDKEFMEMLVLFQDGKVPVVEVGRALANNQFGHEYVALANNILVARKARNSEEPSPALAREMKELLDSMREQGLMPDPMPSK